MKNKYILSIIVVAIIVPQVTFAAWWNPLTWKVFRFIQKAEPQIEQTFDVPETKNSTTAEITDIKSNNQLSEIEQLKKEIEDLKKTQTPGATKSNPETQQVKPAVTPVPTTIIPVVSTPKFDAQLCLAINKEEELLKKNISDSIGYFINDLIPIFNNQIKTTDYAQRYNNLNDTKSAFYKALDEFKNKDIARINSSYLEEAYIQDIKDELTELVTGYKDMWSVYMIDTLKLKNTNFYDSYDKNKAYDLIEKDYRLVSDTYQNVTGVLDLRELMSSKYKEARTKNNCD